MKESGKQIEEKLARDIAKLQEAARKKLISSLNQKQQEQVENMLGELFHFRQPENPKKTATGKD